MATLVRSCGFEGWPATVTTNGGGLCDVVSGTPTTQTSIKKTGTRAAEFVLSGASCTLSWNHTADYLVGHAHVYFKTSMPTGDVYIILGTNTDGDAIIFYDQGTGKLAVGFSGISGETAGPSVTTNTWYKIDFKFFTNGTTHTIDWKVDGNAQAQHSATSRTAVQMTALRVGGKNSVTADIIIDDVDLSTTSGDYPLPDYGHERIAPGTDGTHNAGTNVIEAQDGTDIGATTAYDKINTDPIGDATYYIKQSANGTGNYAAVNFGDTSQTTIVGARAYLAYKSSGTSSNEGACIIIDEDTTQTTLWGNPTTRADYSESSNFYKSVQLPNPSGGWDQSAANALTAKLGYSGDSNPVPYWLDLAIEIVYEIVSGYTLMCTTGSYLITGSNSYNLYQRKILTTSGSYSFTGNSSYLGYRRSIRTTTGAYSWTGNSSTMLYLRRLLTTAGSYSVASGGSILGHQKSLWTTTGGYTWTGNNAILGWARSIRTTTGNYTWTGNSSILAYSRLLQTTAGAYSLSGSDSYLLYLRKILTTAGQYIWTGNDAILTYTPAAGYYLYTQTGIYSLTGQNSILAKHSIIRTVTGSYEWNSVGSILAIQRRILASTGIYQITGQDAYLLLLRKMLTQAGVYLWDGKDARLLNPKSILASTGTYTITGQDSIMACTRCILTQTGGYIWTGNDATLWLGSLISYILQTMTGQYVWEGKNAILTHRYETDGEQVAVAGRPSISSSARDALKVNVRYKEGTEGRQGYKVNPREVKHVD